MIMLWLELQAFLDQGGIALYLIALLALALLILVAERTLYLLLFAPADIRRQMAGLVSYRRHPQWAAVLEQTRSLCQHQLNAGLYLVRVLVQISPMLGLFGTVYGMIEIFDVIARQGTGDARAMANGISTATLPTMTGMAVAIMGLFCLRLLDALVARRMAPLSLVDQAEVN